MGLIIYLISIVILTFCCIKENDDNHNRDLQTENRREGEKSKHKHKKVQENYEQEGEKPTESIKLKITKGPFKGKIAYFDKLNSLWIIEGDLNKAPKAEKYKIGNDRGPGVNFDTSQDYPRDFKKIYWLQNLYGENSLGESNLESEKSKIKNLLSKGFGVISSSSKALLGEKYGKIGNDPVLFHPKMLKSAKEFCKIIRKNRGSKKNEYEIGALLGYKMSNVYAWCFGVEAAKRAFPSKTFEGTKKGYDNIYDWKEKGLSRLKRLLGEELEYIVAGDDPKPNISS